MIGADEKDFIRGGFKADVRSDGRRCLESRPLALSLGDLQQCSGSARCTLGSNDVIVGVKVSLLVHVLSCIVKIALHGKRQMYAACECRQSWDRRYQTPLTAEESRSQWNAAHVQAQSYRCVDAEQHRGS